MPVVVMHGSGAGGGNCTLSSKPTGPNSHMCIALLAVPLNPLFGIAAVIFSCWSRHSASMDWDGAQTKGRIALRLSIAGVIISAVVALVLVLFFFTKDT